MSDLAIIAPGRYRAEGSYGFSDTGLRLGIECTFSVAALPDALVLEGRARRRDGGPEFPLRLQLDHDADAPAQAHAAIALAAIPELTGRVSLSGPTRELLAADWASRNQLSARIVPLEGPRRYELSGFLALDATGWFPFHFRVAPAEPEEALENVVALHKRLR